MAGVGLLVRRGGFGFSKGCSEEQRARGARRARVDFDDGLRLRLRARVDFNDRARGLRERLRGDSDCGERRLRQRLRGDFDDRERRRSGLA